VSGHAGKRGAEIRAGGGDRLGGMEKFSLNEIEHRLLERAASSSSGRGAETVYGGQGNVLRQTVLSLRAGSALAEHESPGEATLLVLRGRVRLRSGDASIEGTAGELLVIPPARHALEAVEDSAVLLTTAKSG